MTTTQDIQSGQEVAKQFHGTTSSRYHLDYWKARLYRKSFTRDGERHEVAEWSVRLQHLRHREAFALGSANANVAAAKAKDIATFLEANGWDAALGKYKPRQKSTDQYCMIGEFLADVEKRSHLKPITVRRYAVKLRKLVGDLTKVDSGLKGKAKRAKYDCISGGRDTWRSKVDSNRTDILSSESITAWRNRYVTKAGNEPSKRKSAERSAASILRSSRALFASDILAVLTVNLPPNPFAGVKLKDPGPQRYHSETNPEWLLACAERDLREKEPNKFVALFLCIWAGLRRKEADLLMWNQVDLVKGQIHVRRTEYFEPKTEESQRTIDMAPGAIDVLRRFKGPSTSEFVIAGADPNPAATYDYYRCDTLWRELNKWLREKGVRQQKAIHAMRKESGSLIASTFGIEAARQHLGHRDIRTTSSHYVDKKRRIEVSFPELTEMHVLRVLELK